MRKRWTETTLGEISDFVSTRLSPENIDINVPYVGLEHVEPHTPALTRWGLVANVSSSVTPFEPGDVLFGRLRPYLHKVAFADFPGVCSPEILVLRASFSCIDKYLYLLCSMDSTVKKCVEMSAGTRMPRTSTNDLASILTSLPPLAEQRRIVDVVTSVDAYIDALQQQADTARTARNAVLHELLSAGGDDWTETTLGEISELVSRGRAPSYCDDDGVVVLNQKCVRYGRIFFEFARRTDTTKKTIPEWAYLKVGDTLINSTGVGTLGRASFVSCLDGPTTYDSHVTLVRPRDDSSFPQFIGMTLNFRENEIEMFAGGSTGQTELSREAVNSFPISLPPLDEQKRIVEIVSSMDDVIQATEQAVTEAKNLRSGLLSDLLSGEHEIPESYDRLVGAA